MRGTSFRNSVLGEISDVRLNGTRLSGQRLIGMRPNGMRPDGMRPNGMRPNGMRLKGYGSRERGLKECGPTACNLYNLSTIILCTVDDFFYCFCKLRLPHCLQLNTFNQFVFVFPFFMVIFYGNFFL